MGDTPWDHRLPDVNLTGIVAQRSISPCSVLDVGCGAGDNAIWLAQKGFVATGCDISPTAIREARRRAKDAGINCSFFVVD